MLAMIEIELKKIWRSKMPICLFLAFAILLFFHIQSHTWNGFISEKLNWFTMVMGMMGFGIFSSWQFGREYQDETFKDLLALPVSRNKIICAKLVALAVTEVLLSILSVVWIFAVGLFLHLGTFHLAGIGTQLVNFGLSMVAAIGLTFLFPLIASLSRGILAPISVSFATLLLGKLVAADTIGHYFPWSVPMLQAAQQPSSINAISWLAVGLIACIGVFGTMVWWTYGDHTD